MTAIHFVVPGKIGGKGRPRAFNSVHGIRTYTPDKTRSDQGIIRHFAMQQMRGHRLLEGPVELDIVVFRRVPKSWSQKKRASAYWVTGKPDVDNTAKLVMDSLGPVIRDDSQIAILRIARYWHSEREEMHVHVRTLEERAAADHGTACTEHGTAQGRAQA